MRQPVQPSSREIVARPLEEKRQRRLDRPVVEALARALERDDRLELAAGRVDRRGDRREPGLALAGRLCVPALAHALDLGRRAPADR